MAQANIGASVLAGLAIALLAGCGRSESSASKPAAPPPPAVTVAEPLKRMVPNEIEQVGRFVAVDAVEMRARVSGYLAAVHFRDGEIVQAGTPLFTIDRRPFEIALDQARATVEQAKANLALADADLARAKDLVVGTTITRQSFDQRIAARRAAEATVAAQSAAARQAALDLEFTELKAPIMGRIGDRRVSAGNFVTAATTANSTLLATIQSIDPIRFEFTLDESAYLRFMRANGGTPDMLKGVPVKLKLIDEREFVHEARMHFIDNAFSRTNGSIRGRAELANPGGAHAPGMFARIRIPMGTPTEALLVPDSAIGTEQVRKFVLVVGADDIAKVKYVQLGEVVDGLRVVESGVNADDRIIIDGLMRARAGIKVAPQQGAVKAAAVATPASPKAD